MIYKDPIFNFGILQVSSPRSGSTLLANIFNSSPYLLLMNEVFTRAPSLLPIFEKDYHINLKDEKYYQKEFLDVYNFTLPIGHHLAFRNKQFRFLINLTVKVLNQLESHIRSDDFNSILHKFWYINSLHQPLWKPLWDTTFAKSKNNLVYLKEVRIKKTIEGFSLIFPNGKIIFLIRHPYGFLSSTMRSRAKQDTSQIPIPKKDLYSEYGNHPSIDHYDGSKESKFLLTWRLSNEWALNYLRDNFDVKDYIVVKYEDLIRDPKEIVKYIHKFLNLPFHTTTDKVLQKILNFSGNQKHERSVFKSLKNNKILSDYTKDFNIDISNRILEGTFILDEFNYKLQ